ncbi:related to phosphoserine phosphatase fcp1 [Rhynchosporium agropyri]|uniref:RNA polymerase II subunit A C-terminal domain phosphatase n=1 Tax=Rhynchosporium agropyri TaxID=914238 RepID=A0A1E1KJ26_9HELO|nr:related to phosphoserine phosphatase fcp1 [Rhynchosporium agropyri]
MGKLLSFGAKLKYPITIVKILKQPGDSITKLEPILQYKWSWTLIVGDPNDPKGQWPEEQIAIGDWESPVEGTLKSWKVKEGMVIDKDMRFVDVEETCPHSIQFQGLCGICGKDMTEMNWTSTSDDTERAKINMIHDQTSLKVSQDEASKAEGELQKRLLAHRKLSLVVDLDQTIIHACIEPTVGEWQRDKTSPNYEAVKDVRSFQLNDDGPRGLASGCWYYIKMRPGLKEFLAKVSEMYELHVYTMGTRAYAINIAKIVDPDKKLFGDRIISRDENGNVTAKSLARLFPVDTKMVVIIDDRADVWPSNRPNLIKVVPYDFFLGIGDINSSFLPKREEMPAMPPPLKKKASKGELKDSESKEDANGPENQKPEIEEVKSTETDKLETTNSEEGSKISALEELVRMGSGDDQALRLEQAAEQEKFLEKQLTDRPLLHMQEKLDKEDNEAPVDEAANGSATQEPQHRHNLLVDNDVELKYLEQHLTQIHKAFYDEYEGRVINASGGRVAQLKPGLNKKMSINGADRKVVPDIGNVMPRLKAKTLAGCTIVMSGLVPLQADIMRTEIGLQAASFGADIQSKVNRKVTHLVASTSRTRTHKVRQAAKYPNIKIVNQLWLLNSMSKWQKEDETPYLVTIHEADRARGDAFNSDAPSSINESDGTSDDSASEDEDRDSLPASSQDETAVDEDGVMPDDMEGGISPIDNLKGFDWGGADHELDEFMASDSEANESGNESDVSKVSTSSGQSKVANRDRKRNRDTATEDEDSDEESTLAKKQRVANLRTTGLKTVKTPLSDTTNLPTPAKEDGASEDGFDDLEADLEAAFASEEAETLGGNGSE